ncbi:ABC transporter permease [Halorussus gelatinilyticus]|uniref:ABC transporter permease n=1 Tax=Halorussus gelatinilyticus TaxID=2937524 RepID=A0A8U0IM68_9EURY|nr:ABC transporter permease [Halorussus gelatinilyticus]UPW01711.1 ABC transporter permease [Halorussus gelatinilyticus]
MATETGTSADEPAETTGGALRLDHNAKEWLLSRGLWAVAGALLVFLWIPLLVMMFLSFAVNASTFFPFRGFTLAHYAATFADGALMTSLFHSVQIATLSASIATVLGVLASFALARYDFPFKEFYRTFGILPMVIPGVVLGIALLIYFRALLGITPGFLTVVLTHSVYGFPFVLLMVTARLYTFDESLEEAARDLGADPLTTFWDITLPIVAPAIGAGFLFAWIRSFEDFIRAYFVKGTMDVLTTSMYSMIKYGTAPKMNAISSLIVFVIAAVLAVAMNVGNVTGYVAGTQGEE